MFLFGVERGDSNLTFLHDHLSRHSKEAVTILCIYAFLRTEELVTLNYDFAAFLLVLCNILMYFFVALCILFGATLM